MTGVKICGIRTDDALQAAIDAKADFIGFVFYPRSKRFIEPAQAVGLIARVPPSIKTVGLFVDAQDEDIERVLSTTKIDMLQLHGDETAARIAAIRSKYGLPVLRAIRVAEPADLIQLGDMQSVADWILFDAKTDMPGAPTGGNGVTFDWRMLKNLKVSRPWMLSGGLNAENVKAALAVVSPQAVDVSSGVEDEPGVKSPKKIREFINIVKPS